MRSPQRGDVLRNHRARDWSEPLSPYCPYSITEQITIDGVLLKQWSDPPPPDSRQFPSLEDPGERSARQYNPPELNLPAHGFLDAWLSTFAVMRPVATVASLLDRLPVSRSTLGVHIRRTDKIRAYPGRSEVTSREGAQAERDLTELVRSRAEASRFRTAYLASDSAAGKAEWTERLQAMGLEVISHDAEFCTEQLRQTSANDFFVDLFSLARCGAIVGNARSGVVTTAGRMGMIEDVSMAARVRARYLNRLRRFIIWRLRGWS